MIDPPLHRPLALPAFVLRAVGISTLALVAVAGLVAGSGSGSVVASALVSDACATLPSTMTAVLTSGSSPDGATSGGWNLRLSDEVPVPCPGAGQVLVKVLTTAVNPVDWKLEAEWIPGYVRGVAPDPAANPALRLDDPAVGLDFAGTVAAVGSGCEAYGLVVGGEVWGESTRGYMGPWIGSPSITELPGFMYAQYGLAACDAIGVRAAGSPVPLREYAALPVPAGTAFDALRMSGAPWKKEDNVTVAVASGAGGTGIMMIQLAKALGARTVVTAASPRNHDLLRALGADVVLDYHEAELWEGMPENSVDHAIDNFGDPGTADRAMRIIRPGGTFLIMPAFKGESYTDTPKPGVTQLPYLGWTATRADSDVLSGLVETGKLRPVIYRSMPLAEVTDAWDISVAGKLTGKILLDVPQAA